MRSMWAAKAAAMLWAGPAWAWEWSDLRAALPQDASWSAASATEMAEAISALLAGGAQATWIEGSVETPLPLGVLIEGGPDAAAAHVAAWTWRAGRRP